jgi:phosphatidyl-myo-inositol alpha-mannosyltransferase
MGSRSRVEQVALVSPYDFVANGGVTEHVRQLARHLRRHNIDVTIIAPSSRPDHGEVGLVSLGPVTPVPINGSVARTTLSPVVMENVAALLARRRFDIIHLHEPFAPMLPVSVLNASGSPNVGTFHASGQRSLVYAASRALVRWLAKRLAVRIAVSDAAAHFVHRYIGGEYTIIPNGVDTHVFNPNLPPLETWHDSRPNVLFVGRFDESRKGFAVLFDAWTHVRAKRPDARLLVVGRGDPEPFQKQAADFHWDNVHFVGSVSGHDLPRYYRTADIFCAPSTGQESFGIVLVEAMSSGTPIVASDIAGYRQVVHHRHEGLLVPPQQPTALAAALLHLLDNPELQETMGRAGRETALQYSWEGITERVIDVYERACAEHHAQAHTTIVSGFATSSPDASTTVAIQSTAVGQATHRSAQTIPDYRTIVPEKGGAPMLTKSFEERVRAVTQVIAGRLFGWSGISPNTMTTIGLLLTLSVTATLAAGHHVWGGILVLLTSAFDMLDGALARATDRKSTFGAFFDSTVDRYTEALILLGLLLYYNRMATPGYEVVWIYLALVGSLMVSYTRARAEALGFECKVGLFGRPERIILLSLGLLVGWVSFALIILAIFTNFTAAQRVYHVWREDRRLHPQVQIVKTPRRGWFAPRDHTPS